MSGWNGNKNNGGKNKNERGQQSQRKNLCSTYRMCYDRLQHVRQKLGVWYNSHSNKFPDGTKMQLVPTFSSVLSANNKTKFASCLARQAALAAGMASASTWEMTTNLLLDKKRTQATLLGTLWWPWLFKSVHDSSSQSKFSSISHQWQAI